MTGFRIMAVVFSLMLGAMAPGQVLVESWQVNVLNYADTGNDWLAQPNRGHSIDFVPAEAAENSFDRDVLVLLTEEDATGRIRILDAETGDFLQEFNTVPTGDPVREHARMRTCDDGFIYVVSFGGIVQRYNLSGTWLDDPVTKPMQTVSGSSRAIAVTGKYSDESLKIFVARGNKVAIFGWAGGAAISHLGTISTTLTGDIMTLATAGDRVYCGSIPSLKIFMHEVSFAPFSFEAGEEIAAYAGDIATSMDIAPSQSEFAVVIVDTLMGQCGVGRIDPAGTGFTHIAPVPPIDFNSDGLYDGGVSQRFRTSGGTADICIEPDGSSAYAYFPHNNPGGSPPSAAIAKVSVASAASAEDWMIYY